MYIIEKTEVSPVDRTVDASILQSTPTCDARLESSPELYFLKKSAGSDMILIMVAASTDMLSFVSMREVIMFFTAVISNVLTETHTEKNAMERSRRMLPDVSTRSNNSLLIIGEIIPMSDKASVARAIITKSDTESVRTIYAAREGKLSFFSGKGL